jgi:hypothetical protein
VKAPTSLQQIQGYLLAATRHSFFNGVALVICFNLMFQDYLGLEGYIELLRKYWVDIDWTLWLIPIGYIIRRQYKLIRGIFNLTVTVRKVGK